MVLENVINITNFSYKIQNLKRYFQRKENITNSSHETQNSKHYFQPEMPGFSTNYARSAILVFPLTMQTALFGITCCLPFSCHPRCALVWGMVVRGLHVEIFVRVLRSSRVNLNNVNNTNVFCCVCIESPFILVIVAVLNSVLQKQYQFTKCSF